MKRPGSPAAVEMSSRSRGWMALDGERHQWFRRPRSHQRMAINWGRYNPIKMQYLKERKPQKLWLELLGKSYVGLIYWTALVEFLRSLFWFQLKAGGLAPQVGFLAYLFIPSVAVGRPFFRQFLDDHPWARALLVVGGVLGLWGQLQHSALRRVTLSACGVGLLGIYVGEGMWAGTTARRERTAFGMVGGILLLQVLRWAYGGPNPLVARWWGTLFLGIIPGVCSALLVLCEDLAESEGEQLQSFLEEDEDVELEHIDTAQSDDDADTLRFQKVDVTTSVVVGTRTSNGQHDRHGSNSNANGNVEKLSAVVYSSVNVSPPDEVRAAVLGTGNNNNNRDELELVEVKAKFSASEQALNSNFAPPPSKETVAQRVTAISEDPTTGEIVESNAAEPDDEPFRAWSWGFGSDAFREVRAEIGDLAEIEGFEVVVTPHQINGDELTPPQQQQQQQQQQPAVVVVSSPMKKTRRAQLIDQFGNSPKASGSPKSSGSPMKNKRWGEGEEVPWLMDIRGDQDISESELELYRHKESKWSIGSCMRTAQMGIGSGSLLFLTHWVLTAPTSLPRWQGLSSHLGWVSIVALTVGLLAATEYPRILCLRRTQGIVFWVFASLGASLFMWSSTSRGAVLGGALLAFCAPSLWISIAQCNLEKYPGGGLGIMALVYIVFVLWSTSLVAYQSLPALGFLRGTRGLLMGCAIGGIGLGVGREPGTASNERAAHGGIWRGLFTSEIDARGRQAVGALIAVVGIVSAVALGVRLQHPSTAISAPESLKVLNFNVYQGFSRAGTSNYNSVLSILHKERPHFAMLQETDLMHIVHGNGDEIDYWSTWLRMHSLYTPPTKADTWGCAMLSLYPFTYSESGVLDSPKGENACYQYAQVEIGGKVVHLMNAHFGTLEDEIALQAQQMGQIISRALSQESGPQKVWLLFGGDINSAPLSLGYNRTVASGLEDAYVSQNGKWKGPEDRDPGAGYVFSSPDFNCTSWTEPPYDQQKTADGDPIVATFEF